MNTKQVIVIRKDLGMRKGKMCAQAAHASMSFLTKGMLKYGVKEGADVGYYFCSPTIWENGAHIEEIEHWLQHSFRKICVYVESEGDLIRIHERAKQLGLVSHLIEDNGVTEFDGIPTKTCCAIGPHWEEKFEGVTSHLPLL
jgi:PTH2 family peptidyl-tRNA hydrolase